MRWFCVNLLNIVWWFPSRRSCIDKRHLIPIERPFHCTSTKAKNESVQIKCCRSPDMCNRSLKLKLTLTTPKTPPGRSDALCTAASRHPASARQRPPAPAAQPTDSRQAFPSVMPPTNNDTDNVIAVRARSHLVNQA